MADQNSLSLCRSELGGRTVGYLMGGDGPPLLFIHGWAVTPYVYKEALDLVASSGHRIIAPFLPGVGPSEALSGSFSGSWPSLVQVSEWLEALVRAVGIDMPVVVAGHSLGGGIATSYAAQFPGRIERLYLLSSVGGHQSPGGDPVQTRSVMDWMVSLPMDLLASRLNSGNLVSMVGSGIIQLIRDPIGLWKLSRVARYYQLFEELAKVSDSGTRVFVVGALGDKIITRDAVVRLAEYASVEPIWVSGTHSWISTHPGSFAEVVATLR